LVVDGGSSGAGSGGIDGTGEFSYAFPDAETEIEQMVEAVLTEPVAEPSAVPQPRGGVAAPATLSVVIPMFDEAHVIDRLFAELEENLALAGCSYEIICVNDGSQDETLARLTTHRERNPAIKIISLSRNFGKDIALTAGLSYCTGAAVLPFDADLQDPPELIPAMLARWREGYDIVNAVRRSRDDGQAKRLGAALFYRAYNAVADTNIPPEVGDFRLIDRRVVNILKEFPERTRFMKGLFAWVGFRQSEIPFDRPRRHSGGTSWSLRRLTNFAIDGITAFSTAPLRMATYIGAGLFLLALLYVAFLVVRVVLVGRDTPGYASLMVTVLLFGGIQFTALGILGEYIGRIYQEVKRRPLFIVEHTAGFDEPGER
jgi:glycosyltransferase involved in cell wall biosynthesis